MRLYACQMSTLKYFTMIECTRLQSQCEPEGERERIPYSLEFTPPLFAGYKYGGGGGAYS